MSMIRHFLRCRSVLSGTLFAVMVGVGTAGVVGCASNSATGDDVFAPFMSEAEEKKVGKEEHPKVLAEFGGAYNHPELQRYVSSIGNFLKSTTPQANEPYTFTVLDSDMVNAFALPGGYVYVTRGLMALANDEAEFAGVVGHEIGHVVARHTAQRYSQGVIAGLGAAILGAITKSDIVGNVAQMGAAAYVQGFSRDQELEADQLGVQYLTRAGFHPMAMASFLGSMEAESALALKKAGKEGTDPAASLFSSHPRTADRIVAAAQSAAANASGPIARDQDVYFRKINGMIYGDSPEQGYVRGRNFSHPKLKFSFDAPPGFAMQNSQAAVIGRAKGGSAMLQFDGGKMSSAQRSLATYVKNDWAPNIGLGNVETFTVNGMEAATGRANVRLDNGPAELRLVAIRYSGAQVYRFLFIGAPNIPQNVDEQFRETVYSFRKLSDREAAALKPRILSVVTVKSGDTAQSLAKRMAVDDYPLETFLTLNGLKSGQALQPGRKVKLVAWGK